MKNPHLYPDDLTVSALRDRCATALVSTFIHYAAAAIYISLAAILLEADPDVVAFAAIFGAIAFYALIVGSIELTRYQRLQRRLDALQS